MRATTFRLARTPLLRWWIVGALGAALLSGWLSACDLGVVAPQTITLVAIVPSSEANDPAGQAMSRAVDLAVAQNSSPGGDYTLTVTHVDAAAGGVGAAMAKAVANARVVGVIGPFDSQVALDALPALAQAGVVTLSPTASLPGLTQADQATAEGLTVAQLHPQGKPTIFFRLTADDNTIGSAAADFALASPQLHGLGAHSVFVVDDGSLSGKAQSVAFQSALAAGHGVVEGSRSVTLSNPLSLQTAVSAIIIAHPDTVFFAGDPAVAAALRRTLTQTGAPSLPLLVAGAVAGAPTWSSAVGGAELAQNTVGLSPAPDLATLPSAKAFEAAYQKAYPGAAMPPQSALAYDAAMVEIQAIKSLLAARKTPSRAAVLSAVAATTYSGATGQIAFDKHGDRVSPPPFAVYACDAKGVWEYQASVGG